MTFVHIAEPSKKKCYAVMWSYGEICVHCGCCGEPGPERDEARLAYWLDDWERHLNFNYWSDDPQGRAIQEKNHKLNHKYILRRLRYYRLKVAINRLFMPDYETHALEQI